MSYIKSASFTNLARMQLFLVLIDLSENQCGRENEEMVNERKTKQRWELPCNIISDTDLKQKFLGVFYFS